VIPWVTLFVIGTVAEDRPCMIFYWSAIVTIALSCTTFELFGVEYYRDLEIWLRDHSRSLKLVPFESLAAVSYSSSRPTVTMAVFVAVSEMFGVKEWCDLENKVRIRSRSLEMAPFDRSHTSSYSPKMSAFRSDKHSQSPCDLNDPRVGRSFFLKNWFLILHS